MPSVVLDAIDRSSDVAVPSYSSHSRGSTQSNNLARTVALSREISQIKDRIQGLDGLARENRRLRETVRRLERIARDHNKTTTSVSVLAREESTDKHAELIERLKSVSTRPHSGRSILPVSKGEVKPPAIYDPNNDIRFWILEVNDFLYLQGITDSKTQAMVATKHLSSEIQNRTLLLRLNGSRTFETWESTQRWLLDHYYSAATPEEAVMKMEKLAMRSDEKVQEFTGRFEDLLIEIPWNDSDAFVCRAFRKRLTGALAAEILRFGQGTWPITYPALKEEAQHAEIRIMLIKHAHETRRNHRTGQKRALQDDDNGYTTRKKRTCVTSLLVSTSLRSG